MEIVTQQTWISNDMLSDTGTVYELPVSAGTSDCERSTRTSDARTGKYQPIHGNPYSYNRCITESNLIYIKPALFTINNIMYPVKTVYADKKQYTVQS